MTIPARLSPSQRERLQAVAQGTEGQPQVTVTWASEIEPEEPRWLWEGRIPLGATTALVGRQGLGKSTFTCQLAALLSRGVAPGHLIEEPGVTLFLCSEDSLSSVIVPRLRASEADMSKAAFLSVGEAGFVQSLELPTQIPQVLERARETKAKLLVIDPISSFLSPKLSENSDQDVRQVLVPLTRMADQLDLAVLFVRHVNKAVEMAALDRVGGAVAWTSAARSTLLFGDDPDDYSGNKRVIAHLKSNNGELAPALSCAIEQVRLNGGGPEFYTSRLSLGGNVNIEPRELLDSDQQRSEYREAKDFLLAELGDGARPTKDVLRAARSLGITDKTLYRAKGDLRVRSRRDFGGWEWSFR